MPLPKGRYRLQAPYADVSETLGLRGAQKQPIIYEILFVSEFDTEAYKLQAGKWKGEKRKKNNRS